MYVPKVKRKWGYYVLPILRASNIIGRIEFEKQRKDEVLIVKTIWLEDDFKVTKGTGRTDVLPDDGSNKFTPDGTSDYFLQINGKGGEDAQYSIFLDIV